ncbi:Anticodon binding domain-containing protein [Candidatus Kryptonium thompsonii]|nr:Anticodon binding domain-containing protein [Candidatus Kryptonium thompsoni]
MKEADRQGAKFVIIVGEDELKNDKCTVRDMKSGEQFDVKLNQILEFITSKYAQEASTD